ncbi:MAG: carboxymethylenebutenolidase [Clostridium sp. SCN 57-10]|nr:MAG: carboxymethylenebutenolidase [Clostridium sp. SCN 57-10]
MNKRLRIALAVAVIVLAVAAAGFFWYVSDYYHADEMAMAVMSGTAVRKEGNLTILSPAVPGDTGLIFYPGGKVEHTAYLPLLEQLRQNGITCVLVEMPYRLAVFNPNAAERAFEKLPDIQNWYMGGHSLGGAMAGSCASENLDRAKGLVLLGSYLYGTFPPERSLIVYGSEDEVLDRSKITHQEYVVELAGGNHAQFGNYGVQKITRKEQQRQTVEAILAFILND